MIDGDCNGDENHDILDVVFLINSCILNNPLDNCDCGDINYDNQINILDIVLLVNIILRA